MKKVLFFFKIIFYFFTFFAEVGMAFLGAGKPFITFCYRFFTILQLTVLEMHQLSKIQQPSFASFSSHPT